MFSSLTKQPLPVSSIKFSSFCLEKNFAYSSIFHSRKRDSIFTHLPTTRRYPDGEWKFSCADIARENKIARRKKTERTKRFRKRIDIGDTKRLVGNYRRVRHLSIDARIIVTDEMLEFRPFNPSTIDVHVDSQKIASNMIDVASMNDD